MSHGRRCTCGFKMPKSSGFEHWHWRSDLHMPMGPHADKQRWSFSTHLKEEQQLSRKKSQSSHHHTPQQAVMLPPAVTMAADFTPLLKSMVMTAQVLPVPAWSGAAGSLQGRLLRWWPRPLKISRADSPKDELGAYLQRWNLEGGIRGPGRTGQGEGMQFPQEIRSSLIPVNLCATATPSLSGVCVCLCVYIHP